MDLRQFVTSHFSNITELQQAASVWSGCGEIIRCQMNGAATVIKAIEVPSQINHSRIKQSDFALARKRQSYLVEFNWYQHYAKKCADNLKMPEAYNLVTLAINELQAYGDKARE